LSYRIKANVARIALGSFVCVRIHTQGDGTIPVPEIISYTGNVSSIGNGNTGIAMPELVRVYMWKIMLLRELSQILARRLRVHWFGRIDLMADVLAV